MDILFSEKLQSSEGSLPMHLRKQMWLPLREYFKPIKLIKRLNKPQWRHTGAVSYPLSVKWFQPSMALRTGSDRDTRMGTEGAHTSRHTEPCNVPSKNSTVAQVLPNPDSLPSTKRVEQSLDTCGWNWDRYGQMEEKLRRFYCLISMFYISFNKDINMIETVSQTPYVLFAFEILQICLSIEENNYLIKVPFSQYTVVYDRGILRVFYINNRLYLNV